MRYFSLTDGRTKRQRRRVGRWWQIALLCLLYFSFYKYEKYKSLELGDQLGRWWQTWKEPRASAVVSTVGRSCQWRENLTQEYQTIKSTKSTNRIITNSTTTTKSTKRTQPWIPEQKNYQKYKKGFNQLFALPKVPRGPQIEVLNLDSRPSRSPSIHLNMDLIGGIGS